MPRITFTNQSKKKLAGFNANNELSIICSVGDNLEDIMNKLNEFRSPSSQINTLYTKYGKLIEREYWNKLKINEDVSFLI